MTAAHTRPKCWRSSSDEGVEFVDYRFCDLPGIMQHVTVPAAVLSESTFEDGHGFDGSSIRGFQQIQESDMILIPDADDRLRRPVPRPQDAGAHTASWPTR